VIPACHDTREGKRCRRKKEEGGLGMRGFLEHTCKSRRDIEWNVENAPA